MEDGAFFFALSSFSAWLSIYKIKSLSAIITYWESKQERDAIRVTNNFITGRDTLENTFIIWNKHGIKIQRPVSYEPNRIAGRNLWVKQHLWYQRDRRWFRLRHPPKMFIIHLPSQMLLDFLNATCRWFYASNSSICSFLFIACSSGEVKQGGVHCVIQSCYRVEVFMVVKL